MRVFCLQPQQQNMIFQKIHVHFIRLQSVGYVIQIKAIAMKWSNCNWFLMQVQTLLAQIDMVNFGYQAR